MFARNWWTRPALACLLVMTLGIMACTTPTTYEVEMGKQMSISLPGLAENADLAKTFTGQMEAIIDYLDKLPQTQQILASIAETDAGPMALDVAIWGEGLNIREIEQELRQRFPVLENAVIKEDAMIGTIKTSFAQRLEHSVFDGDLPEGSLMRASESKHLELVTRGFSDDLDLILRHEEGSDETTVELHLNGSTPSGMTFYQDGERVDVVEIEE